MHTEHMDLPWLRKSHWTPKCKQQVLKSVVIVLLAVFAKPQMLVTRMKMIDQLRLTIPKTLKEIQGFVVPTCDCHNVEELLYQPEDRNCIDRLLLQKSLFCGQSGYKNKGGNLWISPFPFDFCILEYKINLTKQSKETFERQIRKLKISWL